MKSTEPQHALPDIPPNSPRWAMGVAIICGTLLGSVTTLVLALNFNVKEYYDWDKQKEDAAYSHQEKITGISVDSILKLTAAHATQIAALTGQLGTAQIDRKDLEGRVRSLEDESNRFQVELAKCKDTLHSCQQNKKAE
jgi:peptidoglycan hydrolase CwlO-like protein